MRSIKIVYQHTVDIEVTDEQAEAFAKCAKTTDDAAADNTLTPGMLDGFNELVYVLSKGAVPVGADIEFAGLRK